MANIVLLIFWLVLEIIMVGPMEDRSSTTKAASCRVEAAQKCQRCAFATRKSRNTWTRATDFNSSG
jgi:hypothetical protein